MDESKINTTNEQKTSENQSHSHSSGRQSGGWSKNLRKIFVLRLKWNIQNDAK